MTVHRKCHECSLTRRQTLLYTIPFEHRRQSTSRSPGVARLGTSGVCDTIMLCRQSDGSVEGWELQHGRGSKRGSRNALMGVNCREDLLRLLSAVQHKVPAAWSGVVGLRLEASGPG